MIRVRGDELLQALDLLTKAKPKDVKTDNVTVDLRPSGQLCLSLYGHSMSLGLTVDGRESVQDNRVIADVSLKKLSKIVKKAKGIPFVTITSEVTVTQVEKSAYETGKSTSEMVDVYKVNLSLEIDDCTYTISGEYVEPEDVQEIQVSETGEWVTTASTVELANGIEAVRFCGSDDSTRPLLNGVCIKSGFDVTSMHATDDCRYAGVDLPKINIPISLTLQSQTLPGLLQVLKLGQNARIVGYEDPRETATKKDRDYILQVDVGPAVLRLRTVVFDFPLEKVAGFTDPISEVSFDAKDMAAALKKVDAVASNDILTVWMRCLTVGDNQPIELKLAGDGEDTAETEFDTASVSEPFVVALQYALLRDLVKQIGNATAVMIVSKELKASEFRYYQNGFEVKYLQSPMDLTKINLMRGYPALDDAEEE